MPVCHFLAFSDPLSISFNFVLVLFSISAKSAMYSKAFTLTLCLLLVSGVWQSHFSAQWTHAKTTFRYHPEDWTPFWILFLSAIAICSRTTQGRSGETWKPSHHHSRGRERGAEAGDQDWANQLNLFFNRFDGPAPTPPPSHQITDPPALLSHHLSSLPTVQHHHSLWPHY